MKEISLTQGKVALVDDEDFEFLNQWKWRILRGRHTCYAKRHGPRFAGARPTILMHRSLLNAPTGLQVDHINGDGLDNRRLNLRLATNAQNGQNQRPRTDGTSRFRGVSWNTKAHKWVATICFHQQVRCLGYYDTEIEAARVYDKMAGFLFGEFARLNLVEAGR